MTKGNLGHRKHARLFLAMFVFGTVGVATQNAQATIMGMTPAFPIFITPSPTVTTSTVGLPSLTGLALYTAPDPSASPFNFAVFGLFGGPRVIGSVAGVSSSVPGTVSTAAPVTASVVARAAAASLDPEPATIFLLGSGLFAVVAIGRRRLRAN